MAPDSSPAKISRLAIALATLIFAMPALSQQHRPLPHQVVSDAPGIRPLGKGRHTVWGIKVYDATLWIVGPRWSDSAPHALDIEPGRSVPASTLVTHAIGEMRELKLGDENELRKWQAELTKVIPNLQPGDQVVIFCSDVKRTSIYLNDSSTGQVDDASLCPAIMSVWLAPQTKHQAMRKSLLQH